MDITTYVAGVNSAITNQTAPATIPPTVVGAKFTDLATLTKTNVEAGDAATNALKVIVTGQTAAITALQTGLTNTNANVTGAKADLAKLRSVTPLDASVQVNPNSQAGYYSAINGNFIASGSYTSWLLTLANYQDGILISGQIRDSGTALAIYYDINNTFIGFEFRGTTALVGYADQILSPPSNAVTAAITVFNGTNGIGTLIIKSGFLSKDILTKKKADLLYAGNTPIQRQVKLKLATTDKIILYGDSISSTDYPGYQSAMANLTGAVVYNGGFSGFNAAQLAANTQIQRIFDYNPNVIVALVGANDTGAVNIVGTFGANPSEPTVPETDITTNYNGTYFIQAISHIIRKIKAQYYNIRDRANLTGTETEAEKAAKIDAVLKPYFALCTTLPQKRVDDNNAFTLTVNQQRKRNAIIECCVKYNVHCIDLYNLAGWDMTLEPYWTSPTDPANNKGIYMMDGLHPNKYGFAEVARIVCGQIGII